MKKITNPPESENQVKAKSSKKSKAELLKETGEEIGGVMKSDKAASKKDKITQIEHSESLEPKIVPQLFFSNEVKRSTLHKFDIKISSKDEIVRIVHKINSKRSKSGKKPVTKQRRGGDITLYVWDSKKWLPLSPENKKSILGEYNSYMFQYQKLGVEQVAKERLKRLFSTCSNITFEFTKDENGKLQANIKYSPEEYQENKEKGEKLVQQVIKKYYPSIPDINLIDFPIDQNDDKEDEDLVSRIKTKEGKIIAELRNIRSIDMNEGGNKLIMYRPDILRDENARSGEIFDENEVIFESFRKILTPEEAKEREQRIKVLKKQAEERKKEKEKREDEEREKAYEASRPERQKEYDRLLEHAKEQVREGYRHHSRFFEEINPKTGESQDQFITQKDGVKIKYVINNDYRIDDPELKYFYSDDFTIVDNEKFKIIVVKIEEPIPPRP